MFGFRVAGSTVMTYVNRPLPTTFSPTWSIG
jgi:hypothetical protein